MSTNCSTIKSLLPHVDNTNRYLLFDGNKYYYDPSTSCHDIIRHFYFSYLDTLKNCVIAHAERKELASIQPKLTTKYLKRFSALGVLEKVKEFIPVDQSFILYLTHLQDDYYNTRRLGSMEGSNIVTLMTDYFDQTTCNPSTTISDVSKIHWVMGTRLGVLSKEIDKYREVLGMKCIEDMHPGYVYLHKSGKSISSQYEQDGTIQSIFDLIGIGDKTYLEIGGGSVNDNSYNLLVNGWQGYAINNGHYFMNKKAQNITVKNEWVTKENVNDVLSTLDGLPNDFDFLSIDIDSHDLTIWEAIDDLYRPKVVSIEFNPNFSLGVNAEIQKDNIKFSWDEYSKNYGASLTSVIAVAEEKGYKYVYHLPFTDAFFIREDILPEILKGINPEETFDTFPLHNASLTGQYDFSSCEINDKILDGDHHFPTEEL